MTVAGALAYLIATDGWVLLFTGPIALGGIADGAGRALAGRRRNQKLKAKLEAQQTINKHLAGRGQAAPANAADADLKILLYRVQATDQAYPQLPQDLRADIDTALRPSTLGDRQP